MLCVVPNTAEPKLHICLFLKCSSRTTVRGRLKRRNSVSVMPCLPPPRPRPPPASPRDTFVRFRQRRLRFAYAPRLTCRLTGSRGYKLRPRFASSTTLSPPVFVVDEFRRPPDSEVRIVLHTLRTPGRFLGGGGWRLINPRLRTLYWMGVGEGDTMAQASDVFVVARRWRSKHAIRKTCRWWSTGESRPKLCNSLASSSFYALCGGCGFGGVFNYFHCVFGIHARGMA